MTGSIAGDLNSVCCSCVGKRNREQSLMQWSQSLVSRTAVYSSDDQAIQRMIILTTKYLPTYQRLLE